MQDFDQKCSGGKPGRREGATTPALSPIPAHAFWRRNIFDAPPPLVGRAIISQLNCGICWVWSVAKSNVYVSLYHVNSDTAKVQSTAEKMLLSMC